MKIGLRIRVIALIFMICMNIGSVDTNTTWVKAAEIDFEIEPEIVAGNRFYLLLTPSGEVWSWGKNDLGQLGLGHSEPVDTPQRIQGLSGVKKVFTYKNHSFALTEDDILWGWGYNAYGQIAPGSTNIYEPTIIEGISGVLEIAPGEFSTTALTTDGKVYTWGYNYHGVLGYTGVTYQSVPKEVSLDNVDNISAGNYTVFATTSNGRVYSWGYGGYGLHGNGTTDNRLTPKSVDALSNIVDIKVGKSHCIAYDTLNNVYTWGDNRDYALGTTGISYTYTPINIDIVGNIVEVGARYNASYVVTNDENGRHVFLWGDNKYGKLGLGDSEKIGAPQNNVELSDLKMISMGDYSIMGIKDDGSIVGLGFNQHGNLGNGRAYIESPMLHSEISNISDISTYSTHTLAITTDGVGKSWGDNFYGQLGDNTRDTAHKPTTVDTGRFLLDGEVGAYHSGATTQDGYLMTWGSDSSGQLSLDSKYGEYRPVIASSARPFLMTSSNTYVWGSGNAACTSGSGGFPSGVSGASTSGIDRFTQMYHSFKPTDLSILSGHGLAIYNGLYAWGYGHNWKLGFGDTSNKITPTKVMDGDFAQVAAGSDHSMAMYTNGDILVWGNNDRGQLGTGNNISLSTPTEMTYFKENSITVDDIIAGFNNSFAIDSNGNLWAWGENSYYQLGLEHCIDVNIPTQVILPEKVVQVALADDYTYALTEAGNVYCWGYNGKGYLGIGNSGCYIPEIIHEGSLLATLGEVVKASPQSLEVSWSDEKYNAETQYKVRAYTSQGVLVTETCWTDELNTVIENLECKTEYNLKILSRDILGWKSEEQYLMTAETPDWNLGIGVLSITTDSITIQPEFDPANVSEYQLKCNGQSVELDGTRTSSDVWLGVENTEIIVKGLVDNSTYTFTLQTRNDLGEYSSITAPIDFTTERIVSELVTPSLSYEIVVDGNNMKLLIDDTNPDDSLYQIICGTDYVNAIGNLVSEPIWITLDEKKIVLKDLEFNKNYGIKSKAIDVYGVETEWSEPIYVSIEQPLPTTPAFNTTESKVGKDEIYMVWDLTGYDVNYELEVDGLIIDMKYNRKFSHQGLNPNTTHAYRVRAYSNTGYSPWSDYFYATTEITSPAIPQSIGSKTDNDSVIIQWEYDPNIVSYTIEFNGITFNGVESNYFEMSNLEPETTYNYKIKAVNALGESLYSGVYEATTLLLDTPIVLVDEDTYLITWQAIEGAEDYDVKINGTIVANVTNNQATIDPATIAVNTTYVIEVMANDSLEGKSAWSDAYIFTTPPEKPDIVVEVYALTLENSIQLYWKEVAGAIISYDILIDSSVESGYEDGILIENGLNEGSTDYQMYVHENIEPSTEHNYRFRANTELVAGDWSELVTVTALAGLPLSPKNVKLDSVGTITTLTWDEVPGAIAYEIHVYEVNESGDGGTWQTYKVSTNEFVHRGTTLGIEELYQIRTINDLGTGEWSGYIINNSMRLQSTYEEEVDLNLTASNILDFSPYTLHVYYNADVLTVRDLCGKTPIFETEAGLIVLGEDSIEITKVEEGHITFTVNKEIELGYTWEGIINNIIFEGNITGGTTLDYTVFVDDNTTWAGY